MLGQFFLWQVFLLRLVHTGAISASYQPPPGVQNATMISRAKFWKRENTKTLSLLKKALNENWLCSLQAKKNSSQKIRWLHTPKTGSTFFTTLYRYACRQTRSDLYIGATCPEDIQCNTSSLEPASLLMACTANHSFACQSRNLATCIKRWAVHIPYVRREDPETFVSMFRSPNQRILSAYYFGKQVWGGENSKSTAFADWRGTVTQLSTTPADFANTPGMNACATKMLTHSCFCSTRPLATNIVQCAVQKVVLDDTFLKDAVRRLLKFAFVGVQDLFKASVCLFHAKFGGPPLHVDAELAKFNVSPKKGGRKYALRPSAQISSTWNEQELADFVDVFDEPLFAVVLFRFISDIIQLHPPPPSLEILSSLQTHLISQLKTSTFFPLDDPLSTVNSIISPSAPQRDDYNDASRIKATPSAVARPQSHHASSISARPASSLLRKSNRDPKTKRQSPLFILNSSAPRRAKRSVPSY